MTEPSPRGSDAIGPTAHYTGWVWARNGMSPPELSTGLGRFLYLSAWPTNTLSGAVGGPTLEQFLLARHRLIDHLLEEAIAAGRVSQVLEVACGMSPRGWRFARAHGDAITYVEADLPAMALRKREALARAGSLSEHHRVVEIDALAESGPLTLGTVTGELASSEGLAVVTEGLLSYLDRDGVLGLWRNIAGALAGFADGLYLSDLHLGAENEGLGAEAFKWALGVFVRGNVELHFDDVADTTEALIECGFTSATLHRPVDFADSINVSGSGAEMVRVIDAGVAPVAA